MPNLASVMKDEIRRLARKEIQDQTGTTKKMAAQHRRDIAQLKRQVQAVGEKGRVPGIAGKKAGVQDQAVKGSC